MPFFPGPVPRGFFLNGFSQWELPLRGFFRRPRVASALFPRPSPTGIFPAPTAPWDPPPTPSEFFPASRPPGVFPASHPPGFFSRRPPSGIASPPGYVRPAPPSGIVPLGILSTIQPGARVCNPYPRNGFPAILQSPEVRGGGCTYGSPKGRDPSTLSLPRPALQSFLPHALQVFLLANLVPAFSVFLPGGVDRGQVAASLHTSLE